MTIRSLEIFVEVCRQMNMSRTAQAMMISQSSVSQAVRALEREYHVQLFERLNHSLYLTPAGHELLYLSRQVLKNIEQLDKKMKDASFCSTLRLGVCTTIGSSLIHPLLEACKKQYPDFHASVEVNNSKFLEEKLLAAKLDLAIVQQTGASPYMEYIPFLEDEMAVICSNNHPLAGKTVPFSDLRDQIFIGREEGSGTELLLENTFSDCGFPVRIGWICNSADSVKQAVLHGAGLAIISRLLVQRELEGHVLDCIHLSDFRFARQFALASHKDKLQDAAFRQFTGICRNQGNSILLRYLEAMTDPGMQRS